MYRVVVVTVSGDDLEREEVAAFAMSSMVIERHARRRALDVRRRPQTRTVHPRLYTYTPTCTCSRPTVKIFYF